MDSIVVLDTNVVVAAGFSPGSSSARLIKEIREDRLQMVWNEATRREIRKVLEQIPRLSWLSFQDLFLAAHRYDGEIHAEHFVDIADPDDRKFAALSAAAGATLITHDQHLLSKRRQSALRILTPGEFLRSNRIAP